MALATAAAIATATNRKLLEAALLRLGISDLIQKIFTCSECKTTKTVPDIYLACCNFFNTKPEETVVFEDKYYEIIVYERSSDKVNYSSLELNYGPILLKEKPQQFINKINHELAMLQSIDYQTETIKNKIKELENILC